MTIVYLAGPINNVPLAEAHLWRDYATTTLNDYGLYVRNPMVGKLEVLEDIYKRHGLDPTDVFIGAAVKEHGSEFGLPQDLHPSYIVERNLHNIKAADIVLANLGERLSAAGPTQLFGTPYELGFAYALGKSLVVVAPEELHSHPYLHNVTFVTNSLMGALSYITSTPIDSLPDLNAADKRSI